MARSVESNLIDGSFLRSRELINRMKLSPNAPKNFRGSIGLKLAINAERMIASLRINQLRNIVLRGIGNLLRIIDLLPDTPERLRSGIVLKLALNAKGMSPRLRAKQIAQALRKERIISNEIVITLASSGVLQIKKLIQSPNTLGSRIINRRRIGRERMSAVLGKVSIRQKPTR